MCIRATLAVRQWADLPCKVWPAPLALRIEGFDVLQALTSAASAVFVARREIR